MNIQIPGLSPELAEQLRRSNPDLLHQLEAVAGTRQPEPAGEKILNATEERELKTLLDEMNDPETTPARRGVLAQASLKLRGIGIIRKNP